MTITTQEIKRVATQLFASSRAYVTPFYNRTVSKQEIARLFADADGLRGGVVLISAPMGTGKTFFIDQVAADLGIGAKAKPLLAGEVDERALEQARGEVLFIDEADIKTNWSDLDRGLGAVGRHLEESGRIGLILGDYTLRNPDLQRHFPHHQFLTSFEPLDRPFLQGVLRQRIEEYLTKRPEEIIAPELYDLLVPEGCAPINSFRTVLAFLERLVRSLPGTRQPCWLTPELAVGFVQQEFDPLIETDRQEAFLNLLLDHLAENHPRGVNLEEGFDRAELLLLGKRAGYREWEDFQDEIIDPFGEQGLLLSRGVPGLDETGRFARWIGPYYPSLPLMLLAEG
ncbi:hypothetical protein [Endothiovibrio diazotrophicus]